MNSEEKEEKLKRQVEAILWFISNPDALESMKDETLKAYIKYIKKMSEKEEAGSTPASHHIVRVFA